MADENEEFEITTEAKTTTYSDAIAEDELELSLSLRPLNCSSSSFDHHPKKLLEPSSSNVGIFSKRDAQALRRHEAKLKRDFKRKACVKNDVVVNQVTEDCLERRRKALNLGFQGERAAPPWLGWNNAGGFRPYQGQNGKFNEGKDGASVSSGSSSGISDNCQSISGPGGNSSDTASHSSNPHSQIPTPNVPTTSTTSQLQPCSSQLDLQPFSSNLDHSKPEWCSSYNNKIELITGSTQPCKSSEGVTSSSMTCQQNEAQPINDKTLSHKDPNTTPPSSSLPKGAVGENAKPPKPVGLIGQQKLLFSQMPCVSTTGNGPEGKTITGFLYKYTKAEVSIICVCHGASFSPAGFVEHAGGVDVEYPLKHIRVVPFGLD